MREIMTYFSSQKRIGKTDISIFLFFSALISILGFYLTTLSFFPGLVSSDSTDILAQALRKQYSDWHSPFYTYLIGLLNNFDEGPSPIFLLTEIIFWTSAYLITIASIKEYKGNGILILLCFFMPPSIFIPAWIWDISFNCSLWLFVISFFIFLKITLRKINFLISIFLIIIIIIGVLVRLNGWFAAIPLLILVMPTDMNIKNKYFISFIIFLFIPLFWKYFSYFEKVKKTYPIDSIIIYDLGQMSSDLKINLFPGVWNSIQKDNIINNCKENFESSEIDNGWDIYAWGRCSFVVKNLQTQGYFGSNKLIKNWLKNIINHPLIYLKTRFIFFSHAMVTIRSIPATDSNFLNEKSGWKIINKKALKKSYEYATSIPIKIFYKPITWFFLSLIIFLFTIFFDFNLKKEIQYIVFSSIIWTLTYSIFGVAFDFRYYFITLMFTLISMFFLFEALWLKYKFMNFSR